MLPFSPGDLLMGDRPGIGLCTLWTPKQRYLTQRPYVQVIGNLYSRFGIGILIRNVLATPSIRTIVITGVDNPEPKRRQAQALLYSEFDPRDLFLEPAHVEEFYRRTKIYDAREISSRNQDELTRFIAALPQPDQLPLESLLVPLPDVSQEVYPTARSGHLFRYSSIAAAHVALLKEITTFGEYTQPDSEGHRRQELWQLTVCLTEQCTINAIPLYEQDEVLRYSEALWNGDEPEEITYRYGYTLRHKYGDQIQAALDAFRNKPETYRTVLTLWEPLQSMLRDDEPCLITVHPRIRNGVLDMFAYIRTNEMFRGWPKNAAGLRYLQQKFAEALQIATGELTITSGSAHIYDLDWPSVNEYLQQPRSSKLEFDPKGDWRFTKVGNTFVAEHYSNGRLLQVIREPNVDRLEKHILPFIHDVSHAFYIGRELEKLQHLEAE